MSGSDGMPVLTHDEVVEMGGPFVLGALEPAEAAAVRAHLASCSEDHSEIAELGSVLPVLAASAPVLEPPAGLKARIMTAAAAEAAARPVTAVPTAPAGPAAPTPFPTASERDARQSRRTGTLSWVLRIAAVVAIVALGASNLLLRNQLDSAQAYEQAVAAVLDVAAQPGSLTAVLTPDGGTGSGLAAVDASGDVTLAMQDLSPTSGSTVYTAWVIGADGVPLDIGSFQVGSNGTATFGSSGTTATAGAVLALTREAGPGASAPTMPIISKGVATAPA